MALAFIAPGQGAQFVGMGLELLNHILSLVPFMKRLMTH